MEEVYDKLKELRGEEIVWIIYIGIIIYSFYSNSLERNYFLSGDEEYKKKYRKTLIVIFSILILVYLYFFKSAYDDFVHIKCDDNSLKKRLVYLSFIASFLILISGVIFLYVAYMDEDIDVEIAFN